MSMENQQGLPPEDQEGVVHLTPTKTKLLGVVLGVFVVGVIFNVVVGSVIFALRIQEASPPRSFTTSSNADEEPAVGAISSAMLEFSCDFEGNQCDMAQSYDDDFDWTHGTNKTPTDDTGPNSASSGTHYMYIEASDPCKRGHRAKLQTPALQMNGEVCVRFAYHMYGIDTGHLELATSGKYISHATYSANQGAYWNIAERTINVESGQKVEFVGVCGVDIRGDIAIDQIYISKGKCPKTKYTGFNGKCGKVDLVFVIDNSGSIKDDATDKTYYDDMKRFMKDIVSKMSFGSEGARVGAVRFSNKGKIEFKLGDKMSVNSVQQAIDDMPYEGGTTNTSEGLRLMRTELFQSGADRAEVRNVAVVITDGQSTDGMNTTIAEAQRAKDDDVILIVVGVTKRMNEEELRAMASTPDNKYYVKSTDSEEVDNLLGEVMDFACHGDKTKPRQGDLPHQCGFEQDECDLKQDTEQVMWMRKPVSGLCSDNPEIGQFFMHADFNGLSADATATLLTGTARWQGSSCISFHYKLQNNGRLTVRKKDNENEKNIFSSTSGKETWQWENIDEKLEYGQRITFTAGPGAGSAVSLDNIKIEFGSCLLHT